jgi:hypothetical protein
VSATVAERAHVNILCQSVSGFFEKKAAQKTFFTFWPGA